MAKKHDIEVNGIHYHLNAEGRLVNADDWTDSIAVALAEQDGLVLQDEHWQIVSMLRNFYREYNHAPIMKLFLKEVRCKLGRNFADEDFLSSLFPQGILSQSTKIAGLPCPHREALLNNYRPMVVRDKSETMQGRQQGRYEFEFEGQVYHLTKQGNLIERYAWSEAMAEFLAGKEGIALTDDHWEVINFIRGFYNEYLISPMIKLMIRHMQETMSDEKSNKDYLYQLFPEGPAKQGARIAGLPHPVGCID